MSQISDAVDALDAKVTAITTVADSAITLLKGLADRIRANANAPAKLNELASKLDAESTNLANAITENTV